MTYSQSVGLLVVAATMYLVPLAVIWHTLITLPGPKLGRREWLVFSSFVLWPVTLPALLLFPDVVDRIGEWVTAPRRGTETAHD